MVHSLQSVIGIAESHIRNVDRDALCRMVKAQHHMLERIATSTANGRNRDRRQATHLYLQSPAVRALAIIRAQQGMLRPDPEDWMCFASLHHYAAQMDFYHDCGEPVRVRFEPKESLPPEEPVSSNPFIMPDGGIPVGTAGWVGPPISTIKTQDAKAPATTYRPICSFGIIRRAQQIMVRDVLEAILGNNHIDFNRAGLGPRAALHRVRDILATGEYTHVVAGDIKNCFGSMKHDGVRAALPIPESVVNHVVLLQEETPIHFGSLPEYLSICSAEKKALEGIPQGSLVSSLVARAILDPTLRVSALGGEAVSFADDFLVFAHTEGEAVAINHALTLNLSNHPSGPFALKHLYIKPVAEWFGFLGMRIMAHKDGAGIHMVAAPSNKSMRAFEAELERLVLAGAPPEQVYDYVLNWGCSWDWSMANEYAVTTFQAAIESAIPYKNHDCFAAADSAISKVLGY